VKIVGGERPLRITSSTLSALARDPGRGSHRLKVHDATFRINGNVEVAKETLAE